MDGPFRKVIKMWFEEYKYFPPGFISPYKYQPATDTTKQTGHFTQMIWAATNQVHLKGGVIQIQGPLK